MQKSHHETRRIVFFEWKQLIYKSLNLAWCNVIGEHYCNVYFLFVWYTTLLCSPGNRAQLALNAVLLWSAKWQPDYWTRQRGLVEVKITTIWVGGRRRLAAESRIASPVTTEWNAHCLGCFWGHVIIPRFKSFPGISQDVLYSDYLFYTDAVQILYWQSVKVFHIKFCRKSQQLVLAGNLWSHTTHCFHSATPCRV